MSSVTNKFLIEGLDRLGKDTLISGIMNKRGYYQVLHYSKPQRLAFYEPCPTGMTAKEMDSAQFEAYQRASFRTMFSILNEAKSARVICNRAHLGECVYAPLYRGYSGNYVFELERSMGMDTNYGNRLILLIENFAVSKHFESDGESFDDSKREAEQELFIAAFERSSIPDKRLIIVTNSNTGGFRPKEQILDEVLRD